MLRQAETAVREGRKEDAVKAATEARDMAVKAGRDKEVRRADSILAVAEGREPATDPTLAPAAPQDVASAPPQVETGEGGTPTPTAAETVKGKAPKARKVVQTMRVLAPEYAAVHSVATDGSPAWWFYFHEGSEDPVVILGERGTYASARKQALAIQAERKAKREAVPA